MMNLSKTNMIVAACGVMVGAILLALGPRPTNVALEISIFSVKLSIALFSVAMSLNSEKKI